MLLLIIPLLFFLPILMFKEKVLTDVSQPAPLPCTIYITVDQAEPIELESYLIGVIAAEMPASFHIEALKAQAIASRTYAIYKTNYGQTPIKSTTAHQVFSSPEQREDKWLAAFQQYEAKIEQAVLQTQGQIIMYDALPISAMFHASSNQLTESAQNYSGYAIPYLQSVKSDEQLDPVSQHFTFSDLNTALRTNLAAKNFQSIRLQKNNTNRVSTVQIGTKSWTGREFRDALQLRSTSFTVTPSNSGLTIVTKGYGHGVGMSQHGANEMAGRGDTAAQIIKHYYPKTKIEPAACQPNETNSSN
ncbi:stage II sporulation protein D [Solibacillus sp. FSL H8-0538]|uniref:stage II sporulation protein D n=1 Tax=Solibacillus sp. FSL H8-0538 TaxID=2921400 RepID=UPI0030F98BBF